VRLKPQKGGDRTESQRIPKPPRKEGRPVSSASQKRGCATSGSDSEREKEFLQKKCERLFATQIGKESNFTLPDPELTARRLFLAQGKARARTTSRKRRKKTKAEKGPSVVKTNCSMPSSKRKKKRLLSLQKENQWD